MTSLRPSFLCGENLILDRHDDAYDLRQRADYTAKALVSKEDAEKTLAQAISFVAEARSILVTQIKGS